MGSSIDYEALNKQQTVSEKDLFTEDRYRQFFKYFQSGKVKVLDVGCNTGRGGCLLKKLNPQLLLTGLDCVKSRLDRLPRNIYCDFIYGLSTGIDAQENSFDIVCAGEFIEHLEMSDVRQTLNEFWRVLKPGGRLLMTTPNPNYIRLRLTGRSVLGGAHLSQHMADQLSISLQMIGFTNIIIKGSGKVSRVLGGNFPFLSVYGSYLIVADKEMNE